MAQADGQGDEDSLVDDDSYHDVASKGNGVNDNKVRDGIGWKRKERNL